MIREGVWPGTWFRESYKFAYITEKLWCTQFNIQITECVSLCSNSCVLRVVALVIGRLTAEREVVGRFTGRIMCTNYKYFLFFFVYRFFLECNSYFVTVLLLYESSVTCDELTKKKKHCMRHECTISSCVMI